MLGGMRVTLLPLVLLGCQEGLVLDSYDQHAWTQAADAVAAGRSPLPWLDEIDADGPLGEDAAFVLSTVDQRGTAPRGVHAQDLALNAIGYWEPDQDSNASLEHAPDWPDAAHRMLSRDPGRFDPVVILQDPRWAGREELWLATVQELVQHYSSSGSTEDFLIDELPNRLRRTDHDLDAWLADRLVVRIQQGASPREVREGLPAYANLEDSEITQLSTGRLLVLLYAEELQDMGWLEQAEATWRTLLDDTPDIFRVKAAVALLQHHFPGAQTAEDLDEIEALLEHAWATESIGIARVALKEGIPQFLVRHGRRDAASRWLERARSDEARTVARELGLHLEPPPRIDWGEHEAWRCCGASRPGATTLVPRVGASSAPVALPLVQPYMDACGRVAPALSRRIDDIAACVDASPLEDLVELVIPLDDELRDPPVDELERCLTEVASSIEPGPPATWRVRVIDRTH